MEIEYFFVFKRFLKLNSEYSFSEDFSTDSLDEPEYLQISSFSLIISNLSKVPTIADLIFNILDSPMFTPIF
ncbi:hypothetical protein AYI70_g2322 [Smittium culicis]|uniref:Uncharacterized protein n=1 Tax=Smittium culicis TaxID=133412 RepID=A0A1R1Y8V5_9FUNG|nr:hypothetical protein AYI70_g2322 [Smittium culicis]